ncbi:MAG: hypothetical protein GF311_27445 [Candidatus Lokiarchaeota archaeon]|nr:hypothetical protein [Candidatus Lokiarchaeota archaeon]
MMQDVYWEVHNMSYTIRENKIIPNLFIGNQFHCFYHFREDIAVIHANQDPCHQRAVGYRNSLPTTHMHYWYMETRHHLYLNMVDSDRLLFYAPTLFVQALRFIEKHIAERKVLVHSNNNFSRAPSIALLYLAKQTDIIDDSSYDAAAVDFGRLYPVYQPKRGIVNYLRREWDHIVLPE